MLDTLPISVNTSMNSIWSVGEEVFIGAEQSEKGSSNEGLILYSGDRGKTWIRQERRSPISKITGTDSKTIYAIEVYDKVLICYR